MQKKWISLLVLAVVTAMLAGLFVVAHPKTQPGPQAEEYMEYENAVVEQILTDSTEQDPVSENHYRGNQNLIVRVETGQYAGQQMMADNTVGPIYGTPMAVGDRVTVGLSTYADGTVRCYVYEYDRFPGLLLVIAAFLLVTVLVGGKVGLKSLVSLGLTVAALIFILLPLLLRGWPTIPTTFLISVLVTAATFVILGGVDKKTVCACLGTLAGIALATAFGLIAQSILRIDGYRQEYAEALLQLRQTEESMIGITGLVTAGVIVSALGAVMDVAMSISSAIQELIRVNPDGEGSDEERHEHRPGYGRHHDQHPDPGDPGQRPDAGGLHLLPEPPALAASQLLLHEPGSHLRRGQLHRRHAGGPPHRRHLRLCVRKEIKLGQLQNATGPQCVIVGATNGRLPAAKGEAVKPRFRRTGA